MNRSKQTPTRNRSVILRALHRFSAWLYALVLSSAVGRLLTGGSTEDGAHELGFLRRLLQSRRKRSDRVVFRARRYLASVLERSTVLRLVRALGRALLCCSVNTYGIFLLFFGCSSVVTYYMVGALNVAPPSTMHLITGAMLIVVSLPLFASSRSLAWCIRHSSILRAVVLRFFAIPEERLTSCGESGREHHLESLILAILVGVLTVWIAPYRIVGALCITLLVWLILHDPEIGMLLAVALVPFCSLLARPTLTLLLLVSVTLFGYLVKLLCGKRRLCMKSADWMILLLLALIGLGGLSTYGGLHSLKSALAYVCLGLMYFVVANLVRTQSGVYRMLGALIGSGVLAALLGVWQYVFSTPSLEHLDLSLFADLGGRVSSTWGNPNMLAEALILILPLTVAVMLLQRRLIHGFGGALCVVALGACLIFTWSRGAWLGAIASLLMFFLLLDHRVMSWALLGVVPTAALLPLLPDTVLRRFASILSRTDSSIAYRRHLWQGVGDLLADHWLVGIGVGERAFREVYLSYALPGIETAMHSHSVYLQLLCALGIVGLIVFGAAMLLWLRCALHYVRYGRLRAPRWIVLAGVAGVAALLVMGLFDHVWYNYRIYMLFWTVMGLVTAQLRVGESDEERAYTPLDSDRTQCELLLRFHQ